MKNKDKKIVNKALKGTSIAVKVVLVLSGFAIAAFFAWLGYSFYSWLGV